MDHGHHHSHEGAHQGAFKDIPDIDGEIKHFKQVIKAFAVYEKSTNWWISTHEKSFNKIPQEHQVSMTSSSIIEGTRSKYGTKNCSNA